MTPSGIDAFGRHHLRGVLAALVALALATIACESKSSTSTGPSPVKCQVFLEAPSSSIEPAGGRSVVAVSAQPECAWTAASDAPWITALTPSSGQGNGTIEFEAAANPAATARQGHIAVNDQQVPVQQQPAPCRFEVSPATSTVAADGGTITIRVTTLAGCRWEARTDVAWASLSSNGGEGSGTLTVVVTPSGGAERSGALLVAGQTVTVLQPSSGPASPTGPASPDCVFSLDRASDTVSAAGGPVTVSVSGAPGCPRTATSQVSWITIVAGASSAGSGAVTFNVAPNSGAARTGLVTIGGQGFTVVQAAAGSNSANCSYSIAPDNQSVGAGGGPGAPITITTTPGCTWVAASQAPWISLTSAAQGSGPGTVTFSAAANGGGARAGTIAIAGQTSTVNQAAAAAAPGGCTYAIDPTEQAINERGGSLAVAVSAGAGCGWTARSNDSWIVITAGASGSGNGSVQLEVAAVQGQGNRRTGTVSIAGQTFTVDQNKKND